MKKIIEFIKAIRINLSAVKTVNKISRQFFAVSLINAIFGAVEPYIITCMSGEIVSLVASGDGSAVHIKKIVILVLITIGCTILLTCIRMFSEAKKKLLDTNFYTSFELYVNELSNKVDYATFEREDFSELKETVRRGNDDDVYGIPLVVEVICDFAQGVFSLITAIAVTIAVMISAFINSDSGRSNSFISSPWMLLFLLIIFMIACFFAVKIRKKNEAYRNSYLSSFASLRNYRYYMTYHCMTEDQGAKETRVHGLKNYIINEIDNKYRNPILSNYCKIYKNDFKSNLLVKFITVVIEGVTYIYIGLLALVKVIKAGDVIICYGVLNRMFDSFMKISGSFVRMTTNAEFVELFNEYKAICEVSEAEGESIENDDQSFCITFENVYFRYEGSNVDVIQNLNLQLSNNKKYALVGQNGAGKSTLIKLLCRLYHPTKGVIKLNGVDINRYKIEEYYKIISVAFQDFELLALPVGQNIAVDIEYDTERVNKALAISNVSNRINSVEDGLDQCISKDFDENGIEFSGGERQKFAIARAFYKKTPVFILDEPTAALDSISEADIYDSLAKIIVDKIAIFISHRLSCCTLCDEVIVMENGHIVQIGKHKELLSDSNGLYYELWSKQASYYQ